MKNRIFGVLVSVLVSVLTVGQGFAATVYTKVNNKPSAGWPGTYIIVYEKSATEALVWDCEDNSNNYTSVAISDGKITSEALTEYHVTVTEEGSNKYYVKTANGYIGCGATKNEIAFSNGGRECTINSNGGYVMLETNTNTCRFLCYENSGYRFRFYYDKNKQWSDNKKKNICFYVLGDVEQEDPQNQLDLNYAQADMYACQSKFPTQSNPYDQYFFTYLRLLQEEDENSVPAVELEIYAPTQYSIEGTYKSDYTPMQKYWINCQAGSKHSIFYFINKSEQGWGQAAINLAEMKITKVGPSQHANAYVYHIKLVFTDSNKKIWTLDKDIDVYALWIDCNRQTNPISDMEPVAFALESGNHNTEQEGIENLPSSASGTQKFLIEGQLFIALPDGKIYDANGQMVK